MYSTTNNNRDLKEIGSDGKPVLRVTIPDGVVVDFDDNIEQDFADGTVSAVKAVYKTVDGVALASNNLNINEATVVGVTRTAATDGNSIKYKTLGKFEDSSLSFPINDQIYLDVNGNLTNVAPITGFRVLVGTAINGGIQINIDEPIEL